MSKVDVVKMFVNQRLTAAVQEIVEVIERTMIQYEEEVISLYNMKRGGHQNLQRQVQNLHQSHESPPCCEDTKEVEHTEEPPQIKVELGEEEQSSLQPEDRVGQVHDPILTNGNNGWPWPEQRLTRWQTTTEASDQERHEGNQSVASDRERHEGNQLGVGSGDRGRHERSQSGTVNKRHPWSSPGAHVVLTMDRQEVWSASRQRGACMRRSNSVSSREKMARYRARINADPTAREAYLAKRRERYQKRKATGHRDHLSVKTMSTEAQEKIRRLWRSAQKKRRERMSVTSVPDRKDRPQETQTDRMSLCSVSDRNDHPQETQTDRMSLSSDWNLSVKYL